MTESGIPFESRIHVGGSAVEYRIYQPGNASRPSARGGTDFVRRVDSRRLGL
jgi:hypothetical protein